MRRNFTLLLLILLFASTVVAGIFIYEPKDKLITFNEVEMLKGVGKNLDILKINDQKIGFSANGNFSCGLILSRGKNLVEIRALDKNGEHFTKEVRILSLKNYPDIETLYDGKKHWARTQIIYLSTIGVIEGYPDGGFYPGNPITRGELATWIARAKKLSVAKLGGDPFFDVPKERWRAPYIKAVVDAGFMRGYDNDTFGIDEPISRRQVAEVAVLTEGYEAVERIKPIFVDVPKEEQGAFPIYVAREKGLVLGVSKDIDVFEPDRALTRAEAAALISRFKISAERIKYLFSFEKGFDNGRRCKVNLPPKILSFSVGPGELKANKQNVVKVRVKIADRENFFPISKVKVDLSEIGGAPDAEMFDNASHGDEKKGDMVYSLNLSLEPIESGSKSLMVTAIDRLGWESRKEAFLLVIE
ncbi:MAG: S-layer homology domain-containing protein [Candidatus Margulisiibacteriota bacterium]|nr:S-layer homology domain-containing protein [Candidatus Margulisiibacteriota bacterium]